MSQKDTTSLSPPPWLGEKECADAAEEFVSSVHEYAERGGDLRGDGHYYKLLKCEQSASLYWFAASILAMYIKRNEAKMAGTKCDKAMADLVEFILEQSSIDLEDFSGDC